MSAETVILIADQSWIRFLLEHVRWWSFGLEVVIVVTVEVQLNSANIIVVP